MAFEERYYREELDYLRQLGKLLAQEKPHLARFLAEKEGDPDVERLMEASAFLSGRQRQKLEDAFPEFTHALINMLWPNYLRPVPAMTVIEYQPKAELQAPVQVLRNELIKTRTGGGASSPFAQGALSDDDENSINPDPVCHFTIGRDTWLQPLCVQDVRNTSTLKEGIIEVDFFTKGNVSPGLLDLNKLTFWLGNEDDYTRYQLYLWFSERLMDAELVAGDRQLPLPDLWLEAAGFEREDSLLPWPKNVHNGYRTLQEYFCYPESFFFFHLRAVALLPEDFPVSAFTLRLHFNQPLPVDIKLRKDSLRTYCTPAVNLFPHHAEPVNPDGSMSQYPLRASQQHPESCDIFRVRSVSSKIRESVQGKQFRLWPEFEGFHHQIEYSRQREVIYWHHRTKTSLFHQGLEHTIAFVYADGSLPEPSRLNGEVFTASLVCTNRMLPVSLHSGDICEAVSKNPAVASFSNVTRPTRPLYPVTDGDMHWSLISCMNLNYLSLLDREALIQVMRTFDLPGIHHPQLARLSGQKLDAIEKLDTRPVDRLFKGVPIRGLATTLWINPAPFICEGEIYLLGTVLSHFFALYASINSFHCLKIINTDSQEAWEWQHTGQHALM
ncbi:type VI secretion system baseplate subunit TssF [Citrobacter freundii]|uniref:type VI secretion system baseplate subunit TssF n=1 Tax=Citrobacter freundii TaxID=546 RepID=UPI0025A70DF9|nr:type VI secretion system baseplate subunit TssF [Citrobacter freundii]